MGSSLSLIGVLSFFACLVDLFISYNIIVSLNQKTLEFRMSEMKEHTHRGEPCVFTTLPSYQREKSLV
jgi:hypothetical protein